MQAGSSVNLVPREGTTDLKTELLVNDMVIPLNDFTQQYIGNILRGIALSLGCAGEKVSIDFDSNGLNIYSGDNDIQIRKAFPGAIIISTVKGMLSPLKGVVWADKVMITTRE